MTSMIVAVSGERERERERESEWDGTSWKEHLQVDAASKEAARLVKTRRQRLDQLTKALDRVKDMNDEIQRVHLLIETLLPAIEEVKGKAKN